MSKLYRIKESVQNVAEAIASVLGVEVTIADDRLRRVAGTGRYATGDGTIAKATLFDCVLHSGEGAIIDNPGKHRICLECKSRDHCDELAQVCCPIKTGAEIVGVIALIAFDEEQKQALIGRQKSLFIFLDRMADLLASKISEQERLLELGNMKKQLETVINTVHEGIIAIDRNGLVVDLNAAAQRMLALKADKAIGTEICSLFTDLSMEDLLRHAKENANREISCWLSARRMHCIMTVNVWFDAGGLKGIVATLQEMAKVKKIVSRYGLDIECNSNQILGSSPEIEMVKSAIYMASKTNVPVFIRGESGTGKELFARLLHCSSDRHKQPFIALNCAAIPDSLLESELFGYEDGAFTGARRGGKPGKFELADGGTLFLDEIGDMPLALQVKILRVLQEKQVERVGATKPQEIDVRIISATHKNIEAMVETGEFREDLYYRINVFPVAIPPLRERKEDIAELIDHILARYKRIYDKEVNGVDEDAFALLMSYDWPGNVRELENVMEYLIGVETGTMISRRSVMQRLQFKKKAALDIVPIAQMEQQMILTALAKFGTTLEGKEKTAEALGISKATLYRKIKEYGQKDI